MKQPGRCELGQAVGGGAKCRRGAGHGLGRVQAQDVDYLGQRRVHVGKLEGFPFRRVQMGGGRRQPVRYGQDSVVDGIVPGVDPQVGVGLHNHAQVVQGAGGYDLRPRAGHVQVDEQVVAAGLVPWRFGDFDHSHSRQPVGASFAHGGDGAAADAGVYNPRPFHLYPRLHHVPHRPDADGLSGLGQFKVSLGDARVGSHGVKNLVPRQFQQPVSPLGLGAEHHVVDWEGAYLKTHGPPPLPEPIRQARTGWDR